MQATLEQRCERLVDEPVTLQGAQPAETVRHDLQAEVPAAGRGMAGMRGRFIPNLEMRRGERLQQPLDALGSGHGGGLRSHGGAPAHEACAARTSGREASQAACAIANSANASVSPKNLKFTQLRSLQW